MTRSWSDFTLTFMSMFHLEVVTGTFYARKLKLDMLLTHT